MVKAPVAPPRRGALIASGRRGRGFKSRHPDGIAAGQGPVGEIRQGPDAFLGAAGEWMGSDHENLTPQILCSGSC